MRDGPIKILYHYGLRPPEVYDTDADPLEENNLSFRGPYDESFLEGKEEEMTRWVKVVNQQYRDWEETLLDRAVTREEPPVANRLRARFGDGIELVGYEVDPPVVEAGRDVRVKYVFKALKELRKTNRLFVHVLHQGKFLNEDHEPANGAYPLDKWEPGDYVIDEHLVHIPGTWKSGEARVAIGFWDRTTKQRFPVSEAEGEVSENRLIVARFEVKGTTTTTGMTVEQRRRKIGRWIGRQPPDVAIASDVVFGEKIALVGYTPSRVDVKLAGTVEATYAFQALDGIPANWKLTVKLIRDDGEEIDGNHVPIGGLYPPKFWRKKEYVVDLHRIHIDMHKCRPGTYQLRLGFQAGRKPVPVRGSLDADSRHRVNLGVVTISPTVRQ